IFSIAGAVLRFICVFLRKSGRCRRFIFVKCRQWHRENSVQERSVSVEIGRSAKKFAVCISDNAKNSRGKLLSQVQTTFFFRINILFRCVTNLFSPISFYPLNRHRSLSYLLHNSRVG
ncbi:unnamed protein product, partial [Tenebrio molitor]